jgi:hypothetical protein
MNHKYRPTKRRKRLQVRVLSWYVLLVDNSVQDADPRRSVPTASGLG